MIDDYCIWLKCKLNNILARIFKLLKKKDL